MENNPNSPTDINHTLLKGPLQRFAQNDPSMRLNRLAQSLHFTDYSIDDSTSVSITRRGEGVNKITIGTKPVPANLANKWNMGTMDKNEQILIKLSHELAHAFQVEKGFEKALLDVLNGKGTIPADKVSYIELYAVLNKIGPINALVQEPIYAEQSRKSGNLKMETLEDITELISTYIISDEYFLYRLENSVTNLSQEQKEMVAKKVIEICREIH